MSIRVNVNEDDHFFKGEDKQLLFPIYDQDATDQSIRDGTAVLEDITGWTFAWALRRNEDDPSVRISKSTGSSNIIDIGGSVVSVVFTEIDTQDLPAGTYFHTLWRTDPPKEAVLSHGDFLLQQPAELP